MHSKYTTENTSCHNGRIICPINKFILRFPLCANVINDSQLRRRCTFACERLMSQFSTLISGLPRQSGFVNFCRISWSVSEGLAKKCEMNTKVCAKDQAELSVQCLLSEPSKQNVTSSEQWPGTWSGCPGFSVELSLAQRCPFTAWRCRPSTWPGLVHV